MEDLEIIELYWRHSERAIAESDAKYGAYCKKIAENILGSPEDAAECLNDAWLRTWNAIPPERPESLKMFLAKIVRNLAVDRARKNAAQKRGGGELDAILEEFSGCVPDVQEQFEARELQESINRFVRTLPRREGDLLIRRYFFAERLDDIAARYHMTSNAVSVSLNRTRKKLASYLKKEGYYG